MTGLIDTKAVLTSPSWHEEATSTGSVWRCRYCDTVQSTSPYAPERHTDLCPRPALVQEITDRETLEKLLEEGRAILSNDSIVKIHGDLVGQVVFYSWSERVDAALAEEKKP